MILVVNFQSPYQTSSGEFLMNLDSFLSSESTKTCCLMSSMLQVYQN